MATRRFGARPSNQIDNLEAVAGPTVNDDVDLGYGVDSIWVDTVLNVSYICTDATADNAVWEPVTAAGGGSMATDPLWAAAGDLAVATGDNAATVLAIGAAHSVLWSDGAAISWKTAPELQYIADTGGTTRITTKTTDPNVLITDTLRVGAAALAGNISIGVAINTSYGINLAATPTLGFGGVYYGENIVVAADGTDQYRYLAGVYGSASMKGSGTHLGLYGLAYGYKTVAFSGTLDLFVGLQLDSTHATSTGSITDYCGIRIVKPVGGPSGGVTTLIGIDIQDATGTTMVPTTVYALKIAAITGGTTKYGIYQAGLVETNVLGGRTCVGAAAAPATSAALEVQSTTGALLLPRMTTTQKAALTAVNGMIGYDATLEKFQGYENGAWASFI